MTPKPSHADMLSRDRREIMVAVMAQAMAAHYGDNAIRVAGRQIVSAQPAVAYSWAEIIAELSQR